MFLPVAVSRLLDFCQAGVGRLANRCGVFETGERTFAEPCNGEFRYNERVYLQDDEVIIFCIEQVALREDEVY